MAGSRSGDRDRHAYQGGTGQALRCIAVGGHSVVPAPSWPDRAGPRLHRHRVRRDLSQLEADPALGDATGLRATPLPLPGGVAPSWINVVPPAGPVGQLPVPDIADLASLVLRRCYERLQSGEAGVSLRDAVSVMRLAHEIEHDDALAERDAARRQIEKWQHGLWLIRNAIVRRHGQDAWAAISAEVRKLRPAASR